MGLKNSVIMSYRPSQFTSSLKIRQFRCGNVLRGRKSSACRGAEKRLFDSSGRVTATGSDNIRNGGACRPGLRLPSRHAPRGRGPGHEYPLPCHRRPHAPSRAWVGRKTGSCASVHDALSGAGGLVGEGAGARGALSGAGLGSEARHEGRAAQRRRALRGCRARGRGTESPAFAGVFAVTAVHRAYTARTQAV